MRRIVAVALILFCTAAARAEQLPIRVYTTADGLPRNLINRIVQDPRGFLWICTTEGLALFDGYTFTTYGTSDGLPDAEVFDLLITRRGDYWVATRKGLALFQPGATRPGQPRFTVYAPGASPEELRVVRVEEDAAGNVWCSTDDAVYRVVVRNGQVTFERIPLSLPKAYPTVVTFLVGEDGTVWVATKNGLFRRHASGEVDRFTTADGLPHDVITDLFDDRRGGLWVATDRGLGLFDTRVGPAPTKRKPLTQVQHWLDGQAVRSVIETADGTVWAGFDSGLARLSRGSEGASRSVVVFTAENGLPPTAVGALAEDRQGNLWMGTSGGGAAKLAREGFVTYKLADGLRSLHITSLFEGRAGELCVTYAPADGWLSRFDGARFVPTRPAYPPATAFTWGWNQIAAQDRFGEWWFASGHGLWRFPLVAKADDLSRTAPKGQFDTSAGVPSDEVFRLFEDRLGDVWIATLGPDKSNQQTTLAKWVRNSGRVVTFPGTYGTATAFREDRAGNLWIGFFNGGLARYRDGRFESFATADGLPEGTIYDLHLDHAGRLWAASSRAGLARIDEPEAARPRLSVLTTADGLSSNSIRCITEDSWGRIYVGTGRGVDRLDPSDGGRTSRIRHYTTADGLAPGEPTVAFRDRHGAIWVGTVQGLSKLVPQPERPGRPSPVFIIGVQVEGVVRPVSAVGETSVAIPDLAPTENRLQVEFVGLGFAPGERLRYQYMLEGSDRDWSQPTELRRVNLAGLAAGAYRFRVRAVTADGLVSAEPAMATFTIAQPLWRRWWVQLAGLVVVMGVLLAWHRLRMARALALERVRMQIATDLHDDIGSGLTRVAILSELALREVNGPQSAVAGPLGRIAELSRELGSSMGDIVWAVNPGKDHLSDLAQRMRRYASELLDARNIALHFRAPVDGADRKLDPGLRREAFLIFKESLTNAVRHSGCATIWIDLSVDRGVLWFRLRDDGKGFEPSDAPKGNGLRNMQDRARRAGGTLEVVSEPGRGSAVEFAGPRVGGRGWRRALPTLGGRPAGGRE